MSRSPFTSATAAAFGFRGLLRWFKYHADASLDLLPVELDKLTLMASSSISFSWRAAVLLSASAFRSRRSTQAYH